jgi:hypothetical protein
MASCRTRAITKFALVRPIGSRKPNELKEEASHARAKCNSLLNAGCKPLVISTFKTGFIQAHQLQAECHPYHL